MYIHMQKYYKITNAKSTTLLRFLYETCDFSVHILYAYAMQIRPNMFYLFHYYHSLTHTHTHTHTHIYITNIIYCQLSNILS